MAGPIKIRKINFCQFCGSGTITHMGDSIIFCGSKDPQHDVVRLTTGRGKEKRCGRAFQVNRVTEHNYVHKTEEIDQNRKDFNDTMQKLHKKYGCKLSKKGEPMPEISK